MVGFGVGAKHSTPRERRSRELWWHVIQDDEVDSVVSERGHQIAEHQEAPVESGSRRRQGVAVEQHSDIDVALAMLSPASVAAEEIGRDHSVEVLAKETLEAGRELGVGHGISVAAWTSTSLSAGG